MVLATEFPTLCNHMSCHVFHLRQRPMSRSGLKVCLRTKFRFKTPLTLFDIMAVDSHPASGSLHHTSPPTYSAQSAVSTHPLFLSAPHRHPDYTSPNQVPAALRPGLPQTQASNPTSSSTPGSQTALTRLSQSRACRIQEAVQQSGTRPPTTAARCC